MVLLDGRSGRGGNLMTLTTGAGPCVDAGEHKWPLRAVAFDAGEAVRVFECVTCAAVDCR